MLNVYKRKNEIIVKKRINEPVFFFALLRIILENEKKNKLLLICSLLWQAMHMYFILSHEVEFM